MLTVALIFIAVISCIRSSISPFTQGCVSDPLGIGPLKVVLIFTAFNINYVNEISLQPRFLMHKFDFKTSKNYICQLFSAFYLCRGQLDNKMDYSVFLLLYF